MAHRHLQGLVVLLGFLPLRHSAATPIACDLTGRWDITDVVESTSHPPFLSLRLGWRIRLEQEGAVVLGEGEKLSVNGVRLPPSQRSRIALAGSIHERSATIFYVERGTRRKTEGTFEWALSDDCQRLVGRFAGTAAAASGSSEAVATPK